MKFRTILFQALRSILLSYSQIFFSDRMLFGFLLLAVSFFNLSAGLSGLISIVVANLVALALSINRTKIISGQYGFNVLLVGLGLGVYYQFNLILFLVLIFAAILTLLVTLIFEGWLMKYKLPFLSLPFLIGLWITSLASHQFTGLEINSSGVYLYNDIAYNFNTTALSWHKAIENYPIALSLKTYFLSLAAIFFQYNIYAGLLIALGLLIVSRISFVLSLVGFYSAYLYYSIVGADFTELHYSYIGFNYILSAIAIGGFFIVPSLLSFLWVILLTPIISFIMTGTNSILIPMGLSTYALPFNITVIMFLYALAFREKIERGLQLVIIQKNSPEKNLYSFKNFKDRFFGQPLVSISLPFFGQWKISQAHDGEYTHKGKWQHAWDFVIEENGKEFIGDGLHLTDYHCYNKVVIAPADGFVEQIEDGIEDNDIGDVNLKQNWGNSIVIRHDTQLYSQMSHLKKGSFRVSIGEYVRKGQPIAVVGNSGRSPYPHLHFQLQATPYIGSETLKHPFGNYVVSEDSKETILINSVPKHNQTIKNAEVNQALKKAFGFIPGQELNLQAENQTLVWKTEIDYFNNTYLYCVQTQSKAFFVKNDNKISFTAFEGDKKSALFKFYLAAYQVVFVWNQQLIIEDYLPANIFRNFKTFLQDFIAPFYIFIKPIFKLEYIENQQYFDESSIKLQSTITFSRKQTYQNEFRIDMKGIAEWDLIIGNNSTTYSFIRE